MRIVNKSNVEPTTWQSVCTAWPLVECEDMSVKHEHMPSGTAEARHVHTSSRQFFFVLSGELTLEVDGNDYVLSVHDGLEVAPQIAHQAKNTSDLDVTFLVISTPSTIHDRHPS